MLSSIHSRITFLNISINADYYIAAWISESDLSGLAGGNNVEGGNDFVIARYYEDEN